jgi:putative SOS response-associated peptidase YedK
MSWGWRVPWDKQPLINARSVNITQLPTFKPHLQNRCLILADGFFEKGIGFIQPGAPLFAMAGLWADDPHQNGNLLSLRPGRGFMGRCRNILHPPLCC